MSGPSAFQIEWLEPKKETIYAADIKAAEQIAKQRANKNAGRILQRCQLIQVPILGKSS